MSKIKLSFKWGLLLSLFFLLTCSVWSQSYIPGQSYVYVLNGVSFNMHYVPGGIKLISDDNRISGDPILNDRIAVPKAYWIAETDVTYELWSIVKTWAVDHGYTFVFGNGLNGSDNSGSVQQPVTTVSWREAMIWCNALTEFYNFINGTEYQCVYCNADHLTPIRSVNSSLCSHDSLKDGGEDNPYVSSDAKGFRLPTSNEWELAARYIDGKNWTPGNYASGATDYLYDENREINPNLSPTSAVAVFYYDTAGGACPGEAAVVKSKAPNALGLYDMCGNVYQWCFDWYPRYIGCARVLRGGSYCNGTNVQLGYVFFNHPYYSLFNVGFRPVRTE